MIIIIIAIVVYATGQLLAQKTGTDFYKDNNFEIYDIIQQNTPDIYKYKSIVDIFGGLILSYSVLTLSNKDLLSFTKLFSVAVILRAIAIQTTILPRYKGTSPNKTNLETIIKGNYDKFFSGHFTFSNLLLAFSPLGISFKVFLNAINGLLIVMTRRHYTIDIIGAIVVSQLLLVYKDTILNFV